MTKESLGLPVTDGTYYLRPHETKQFVKRALNTRWPGMRFTITGTIEPGHHGDNMQRMEISFTKAAGVKNQATPTQVAKIARAFRKEFSADSYDYVTSLKTVAVSTY